MPEISVLQKRLSKLSLFDGVSLWLMGVLSLVVTAIWRDATGGLVGLALLTLGSIELRGRWFLNHRQKRATAWLVGSQLGLLAVILSYCLRNIYHPPALPYEQLPGILRESLENLPGFDGNIEGVLGSMLKVVYSIFMLVSVFYQGGMAMHYLRKTPLALQDPPSLPPLPPI